jgi:hypothetical protein
MRTAFLAGVLLVLSCWSRPSAAQQVHSGTGNINSGDGFSEFIGSNWGARGHGWFANFGGGAPGGGAAPPFGGVPGGLSGGFGFGGGGMSGGFGFTAGQGYSSSSGSTSGSITTMNGAPGFLFDGTLTPFVTQIIPVVGDRGPTVVSPLALKLQQAGGVQGLRPPLRLPEQRESSASARDERPARGSGSTGIGGGGSTAERGDFSVAAIRRQQLASGATSAWQRSGVSSLQKMPHSRPNSIISSPRPIVSPPPAIIAGQRCSTAKPRRKLRERSGRNFWRKLARYARGNGIREKGNERNDRRSRFSRFPYPLLPTSTP